MCEPISAFSKAFVDWSPDVDRFRLSTFEEDMAEAARVKTLGVAPPTEAEEAEASALLASVDGAIRRRYGIDPVVARYLVCQQAIASGCGVVTVAKALVDGLESN